MILFLTICFIILVVLFFIWLLNLFYIKASLDMAIIRTGLGGKKVLLDGGCMVLPIVHQIQKIGMSTNLVTVSCENKYSTRTADRMRVDVRMEFEFVVDSDPKLVARAAQAFGNRLGRDNDVLNELLAGPIIDAMQNAAGKRDLTSLHENRSNYSDEVSLAVATKAEVMGLSLVSASLLHLDQSDLSQFDENNVFDAQAKRVIAEQLAEQKKARVFVETTTESQIGQSLLARKQQQLDIDRQERESKISQETLLSRLEYEAQATAQQEKQSSELKQEKANIAKQQTIKLAQVQSDEEARKAEMAAIRKLEQAKIDNEIAIAEKRVLISRAKAKEETARSQYLLAAEQVQTEKERAVTEREHLIMSLKRQAEDELALAKANAEAATSQVKADTDTLLTKAQAEAACFKMEAEAVGRVAQIEAENRLSASIISKQLEEKRLEHLPEIMTQMMKPVEKIDSIRINQISGLNSGSSNSAEASEGSAFASAMDQILGMAVTLPAMKQIGDQIGLEIDPNLAGRTADYANRIKPKKDDKQK